MARRKWWKLRQDRDIVDHATILVALLAMSTPFILRACDEYASRPKVKMTFTVHPELDTHTYTDLERGIPRALVESPDSLHLGPQVWASIGSAYANFSRFFLLTVEIANQRNQTVTLSKFRVFSSVAGSNCADGICVGYLDPFFIQDNLDNLKQNFIVELGPNQTKLCRLILPVYLDPKQKSAQETLYKESIAELQTRNATQDVSSHILLYSAGKKYLTLGEMATKPDAAVFILDDVMRRHWAKFKITPLYISATDNSGNEHHSNVSEVP